MTSCTYRVLALAKSELEDETFVFAIVVRFDDLPGNPLRSYILEHWEKLLGEDAQAESSYVVDVLYDLRQHSHTDELRAEHFLGQIGNLNVGPVRTKTAGTRALRNLDSLHEDFSANPDFLYRSAAELESLYYVLTRTD